MSIYYMSDKLKTGPVVSEAVDKLMKKYYKVDPAQKPVLPLSGDWRMNIDRT